MDVTVTSDGHTRWHELVQDGIKVLMREPVAPPHIVGGHILIGLPGCQMDADVARERGRRMILDYAKANGLEWCVKEEFLWD